MWLRKSCYYLAFLPLACCFSVCLASSARADHRQRFAYEIRQIEQYLNSIGNMKADFVQSVGIRRRHSSGRFYLKRARDTGLSRSNANKNNGKRRVAHQAKQSISSALCIDYLRGGTKAKIVAKNGIATFYDKELDTLTEVDISKSAIAILLRRHVSFNDIYITKIHKTSEEISIECYSDKNDPESLITMVFSTEPHIEIKKLSTLTDEQDVRITLTLYNINTRSTIKDSVFLARST